MKRWFVLAMLLGSAGAHAGRCEQGAEYLAGKDLPRAALYLDGCEGDKVDELHRKLEHSELSALSIVTSAPATGKIDALPDDTFDTPITLWLKAGTHKLHVERDGRVFETQVTLAAHSRMSVVLDVGAKAAPPPRTGHLDFNEQGGEVEHSGPPPDQKHKTLVPHRYEDGGTTGGPQIDDPLAVVFQAPPEVPQLAIGVHAGAGSFGGAIGPSFALTAAYRLLGDDTPFLVRARADYSKRDASHDVGGSIGIAKVLAAPDTAWLVLGAGARFDERTMAGATVGGEARFDLVLRRLPLALGAQYEQTTRDHAIVLEAGFELRLD